jgi:hypothetical protein
MILVYTEHITPRHRYIFDFILEDLLGQKYAFSNDRKEFDESDSPKFSYGTIPAGDAMHFSAHPLLSETGLHEQPLRVMQWNGIPVFFEVKGPSAMPFDPFALSFYLISRYEEYLPFQPDEHGRFPAASSPAYKEGFLEIPLVDIVADQIKSILQQQFPQLRFESRPFRFIPTFDIDIAFAHLGKSWSRATLAWMKLLLGMQFSELKERMLTLSGRISDPYDNFAFQENLTIGQGFESIYFVLLGDFGKYDRNISYKNKRFRKLLQRLSSHCESGIHPSYGSYLDMAVFSKEKKRLEEITGHPVSKNRFHFLRLKFPDSYRMLIDSGIRDDYSMGYSNVNGFRSGTYSSFDFYDLQREIKTDLRIHPFIFMDSAMIDHLHFSPENALEKVEQLLLYPKKIGGEAIGIWHNYSLSEKHQYKGWRNVLQAVLEESNNKAL